MTKCPHCKSERLERLSGVSEYHFDGVTVAVEREAETCTECGASFLSYDEMGPIEKAVCIELARHGVMTGEAMRWLRKTGIGLTLIQAGELIDMSKDTLSRQERGAVEVQRTVWLAIATLAMGKLGVRFDSMAAMEASRGKQPPRIETSILARAAEDPVVPNEPPNRSRKPARSASRGAVAAKKSSTGHRRSGESGGR